MTKFLFPIVLIFSLSSVSFAKEETTMSIINMGDDVMVRNIDEYFIQIKDSSSIQHGVRILAAGIQAWNLSFSDVSLRSQIEGHIEKQGIVNGLIAPTTLLIQRALGANKLSYAENLMSVIQQISPLIYSQLKLEFPAGSDPQNKFSELTKLSNADIISEMKDKLGGHFQVYAQERLSFGSALGFFGRQNDFSNMQELIRQVVNVGDTPEALQADEVKKCQEFKITETQKKLSVGKELLIQKSMDPLVGCRMNYDNNLRNPSKLAILLGEFETGIEPSKHCDAILANYQRMTLKIVPENLRQKQSVYASALDGLRASEPKSCLGQCAKDIVVTGSNYAAVGTVFGFSMAGGSGAIVGGSFGFAGGALIGYADCRKTKQCGGDPVHSTKVAAEIRELNARAEKAEAEARSARIIEQQNRLELAQKQAEFDEKVRRKNEESQNKQKSEAEKKKNEEKTQKDKSEPLKPEARKGVDHCTSGKCEPSGLVDIFPNYSDFFKETEEEKAKKNIAAYFQHKKRLVNEDPRAFLRTLEQDSKKEIDQLKLCIFKESRSEKNPNSFYLESMKEQLVMQEKRRQYIEHFGRINPVDKYEYFKIGIPGN
jgi:hypothetical protein